MLNPAALLPKMGQDKEAKEGLKMDKKAMLPIAGATMAAGAAIGLMMMPRKKKQSAQRAAGKAIKAVGNVVEHLDRSLKM